MNQRLALTSFGQVIDTTPIKYEIAVGNFIFNDR